MLPPILDRAGGLLSRYDVIFCDVWGVVHNGVTAFDDACAALVKFRAGGGSVILVSNAPVPKSRVQIMLESRKVPGEAWDDIVSSGDIALAHVSEQKFRSLYCIGPKERDAALFRALGAESVPLKSADALLCSGLNDDRNEDPDDYRTILSEARDRNLLFICANPDHVVDVGGTILFCAGAIADIYEEMGGRVYWSGKPHLIAYKTALRRAGELRQTIVPREKCLVIGDALRTDIKGAENFGCDAIFVASGIHRHDTMQGGGIDPKKLETLFKPGSPPAIAAMTELRW